MSDSGQSVSSPIATGGDGTFFEQHVGAHFLALLLVRGIPPILKDCQVEEIHFQTEHLGWKTDDVLIVGNRGEDKRRKLVAQVKRSFTISSSDEICKKAFVDFWQDFSNKDQFNPETDRLALITLRGTNILLGDFGNLLDCARASTDGADFERRLLIEGLLSKKARQQAKGIRSILGEIPEQSISDEDFWRFLCILYVISLDLHTQTAQQEALTKTLLAQTSDESDPVAAAEWTWGELLQLVGGSGGMPSAGSYTYEILPEALRQRHASVLQRPSGHLGQLIDHSAVTLDAICTTITGSIEIRREALEIAVLNSLEAVQVTVISGAAGHGKSVVAKQVIEEIQEDYFCLAFRAEEFASSHIDQALTAIQHSLTAKRLLSFLSAQSRKVILVESVERLLESSERKAFMDLLRLARSDQNLRLVLTCRDYSLETVKTSLLQQVALSYEVIDVSPFTDDELEQAAQKIPKIADIIQSPNLRKLLRSPYFLNIAAQIKWSENETLPDSEQEFRDRCWNDVIRFDVNAAQGMPRERENVFIQLALRRAKELRPYVRCDDFDANVLEALRKDSLLSFSKDSSSLAAPSHDVLEDWAIIHWLNSQFSVHEGDAIVFADEIGGYPALRRGYRKWLGEMLTRDFEKADTFILSVFRDETLPDHFRDDTIVCILLSSSPEDFLLRNRSVLVKHDGKLLVRVIHLLRVACKTSPSWLSDVRELVSQLLIPAGVAWSPILKIVSEELEGLLPKHFGVVLGLVEDWSRQVTYWEPPPKGCENAGLIIVRLLRDLGGYSSEDLRRRALEVFAKIPSSVPEAFRDILRRAVLEGDRDSVASDFAELLLTESSCAFVCRDFPKEVIELSLSLFCLTDKDVEKVLKSRYGYDSLRDIESHFGIRQHLAHSFSVPASAIRGPFWSLLCWHPHLGIDFIVTLMNHVCLWYGAQKWPSNPLETAWQINLEIPGEVAPVKQWANGRLYAIYRGTSVAPYVLQSALMALERWLLEIADIENGYFEDWLLKLLKKSNNVAVTAVVASVCIAKPDKCGRAGLALLSSKDLISLDRSRMINDRSHSSIAKFIPSFPAKHKIYDDERIKSDGLPHRKSDLEYLALVLQLSDRREDVWLIIDQHRKGLPPLEQQSEEEQLWRLALHRIDVRGLQVGEEVSASEVTKVSPDSGEKGRYFTMVPSEIEPDLQEIVDHNVEQFAQSTSGLSLYNWGQSAWSRKLDDDSNSWQDMLVRAKAYDFELLNIPEGTHIFSHFAQNGSGVIAAVCIRDCWDEMAPLDRDWCVSKMIAAIEQHDGSDDLGVLEGRGAMFPDRYAAYSLSRVVQEFGINGVGEEVIVALALALTHSVIEVRDYAAEGLGYYLAKCEPDFVMRCVGVLAKQARLIEESRELQETRPYAEQLRGHELIQKLMPELRQDIISGDVDVEHELENLDSQKLSIRIEIRLILKILGYLKDSRVSIKLYEKVSHNFTQIWVTAKTRDRANQYIANQRDYHFEYWLSEQIARFVLKLEVKDAILVCQPLLLVLEDHSKEVTSFVENLIYQEDILKHETPFWDVWQAFVDKFINLKELDDIDKKHTIASDKATLLNALLLGIRWKKDARYWPRLKGQEGRIENFLQSIPSSSVALQSYCQFLYYLGEKSLPNSFTILSECLSSGDVSQVLAESLTIYYLESLLQRFVYGEPMQLKVNPHIRKSVLYILDQLVDAGSSSAYRMRDDFVTPISPTSLAETIRV